MMRGRGRRHGHPRRAGGAGRRPERSPHPDQRSLPLPRLPAYFWRAGAALASSAVPVDNVEIRTARSV